MRALRLDWKIATVIVVSTLAMGIERYHTIFAHKVFDRLLLYLGVPVFIILLIFRESPARYGFQLGDWKAGLALTAAGCAAMGLVMAVVAPTPAFRAYYGPQVHSAIPLPLETALDLFGWEFLFRGFLPRSTRSVARTPSFCRRSPSRSPTLASLNWRHSVVSLADPRLATSPGAPARSCTRS